MAFYDQYSSLSFVVIVVCTSVPTDGCFCSFMHINVNNLQCLIGIVCCWYPQEGDGKQVEAPSHSVTCRLPTGYNGKSFVPLWMCFS